MSEEMKPEHQQYSSNARYRTNVIPDDAYSPTIEIGNDGSLTLIVGGTGMTRPVTEWFKAMNTRTPAPSLNSWEEWIDANELHGDKCPTGHVFFVNSDLLRTRLAPLPKSVPVARLKLLFESEARYWQSEADKNGNDQFALGNCSGFRKAISSLEKLIKEADEA